MEIDASDPTADAAVYYIDSIPSSSLEVRIQVQGIEQTIA
jgi:hypothetical protein